MNSKKTTYYSYGNIYKSTADVFLPKSVTELREILDFCTKNNIVAGAGGIKIYDNAREVCFRRPSGLTYCIISILRANQVKEIVNLVVEAKKKDAVPEIAF